jgi:hypothetical protein
VAELQQDEAEAVEATFPSFSGFTVHFSPSAPVLASCYRFNSVVQYCYSDEHRPQQMKLKLAEAVPNGH